MSTPSEALKHLEGCFFTDAIFDEATGLMSLLFSGGNGYEYDLTLHFSDKNTLSDYALFQLGPPGYEECLLEPTPKNGNEAALLAIIEALPDRAVRKVLMSAELIKKSIVHALKEV